jgi:CBS domain-containing protein
MFLPMMSFDVPIREHMSAPVVVVSADDSLEEVLVTLRARRITSVVVVGRDGRAIGVLSYSDLLQIGRSLTPYSMGAGLLSLPSMVAGDVVRSEIIQADPDTSVAAAARLLRDRAVQRLYVLELGWAVGVFSTRDAMKVIAQVGLRTPIGAVTRAPVPVLQASDPATSAINRVQGTSGACVVVVEDGLFAGIVTQQEALAARELPKDTPAGRIAGHAAICLDVRTPIDTAARFALATRARRIIVTERGEVFGSLSGLDFAAAIADAAT